MTSIISNAYGSPYAQNTYGASGRFQQSTVQNSQTNIEESAARVTLSDAAKATLAATDSSSSEAISARAREKLTDLLRQLSRASPLSAGKLVVDLSALSREEVFAAASNGGNKFTVDEQKGAKGELEDRLDRALSGAHSVMQVTGNFKDLYETAKEYLDAAGIEEKKTVEWKMRRDAVGAALEQIEADKNGKPTDNENDPVAAYLKQQADSDKSSRRATQDVATDARAVLNKIYETGGEVDALRKFGSRTLSVIALDKSDKFSSSEISGARAEIKSRHGKFVQSTFQSAGSTGDPTAFSKKLIAQYASMSAEEREASGLTKEYYGAIVKNYETSLKISQAFSGFSAGGGSLSLVNYI